MLLRLFWLLVRPLSPQHASATGRVLMRRLGPKTHKHRQIKRNLKLAFPAMRNEQHETLAREIWGNFGAVMGEYPHLGTISTGNSPPFIDVVMNDEVRAILENKRPAIYVTAHLGNWELVGPTIVKSGIPLSVIYGPQSNPVLERMLQQQRKSLGCRFIAKQNGIRQLVRELRSGSSVGLLPDQRVDSGEPVPFFGWTAPTTTSPAWLALKFNCPLIPVQVERIGNARFRTIFHRPVLTGRTEEEQSDPVQITTDLNRMFESWIRARPDQWLCIKRRWLADTRHTGPGHERPTPAG
ncbi:MAG: lysophospholipid acyltransferase family protein [Thiogranum sp.]